jgi:TRAP-type uncharacterized transport system substrate-binding protein
MKPFFKLLPVLLLTCSFSVTLWGKPQHIILTGSQGTGSFIFTSELSRIWETSGTDRNQEIVSRPETSQVSRLRQLRNNRVTAAIIDAETAFEQLNKYPELRVLSVLWRNWLHVLGTVPGQYLTLASTKTMLVHDNTMHFVRVWKNMSPDTKFSWFNSDSIPDFSEGFTEEVLAVTAPAPLHEINSWLEQFPGIRLLSLDNQLIRASRSTFNWMAPKKIPANTYLYQSEPIESVAWHPVLVVRRDFPNPSATKLLQLIYAQSNSLNPHPLLENLRRADNIAFQKIYAFHPAAKSYFKFK